MSNQHIDIPNVPKFIVPMCVDTFLTVLTTSDFSSLSTTPQSGVSTEATDIGQMFFYDVARHHIPETLDFATYHDFSEHMAYLCLRSRVDLYRVCNTTLTKTL